MQVFRIMKSYLFYKQTNLVINNNNNFIYLEYEIGLFTDLYYAWQYILTYTHRSLYIVYCTMYGVLLYSLQFIIYISYNILYNL